MSETIFLQVLLILAWLAGLIVCVRGYKKTGRIIFAYAVVFFASGAIYWIVTIVLTLLWVGQLLYSPVINYISLILFYVSLAAAGLMIWGFYKESKA